jgi:hypothetical protein
VRLKTTGESQALTRRDARRHRLAGLCDESALGGSVGSYIVAIEHLSGVLKNLNLSGIDMVRID